MREDEACGNLQQDKTVPPDPDIEDEADLIRAYMQSQEVIEDKIR